MGVFQTRKEKDFEFFVRNIGKLEPVEFAGLARVLNIPTLRGLDEVNVDIEDFKDKNDQEKKEIIDSLVIPMDKVLEAMMDRFLELSRRRRREIVQILKDVQRGR